MSEPTPVSTKCYKCGTDNPVQPFCGSCGSPLGFNDYISKQVKDQLAETIRDRDVLEMDSSIKIFQKAWGWVKLIFAIAAALLVLTGGGFLWKASDFLSGVDKAKQSVVDTAQKSSDEIARSTLQAKHDITQASGDVAHQDQELKKTATKAQSDISKQTTILHGEIDGTRQQLQAANKIQPEMEAMRKQLAQATSEIQAQQKVISSSQDFVKSIFASHTVEIFNIGQAPKDRYAVVPPATKDIKNTLVWLLLNKTPIDGTLQLQYFVAVEPPNSYFRLAHNLIVFFWADPAANLEQRPLSASYFPDASDTETIHSLSEHDGRVWADDQPLPNLGAPDPSFTGNKWMVMQPPSK